MRKKIFAGMLLFISVFLAILGCTSKDIYGADVTDKLNYEKLGQVRADLESLYDGDIDRDVLLDGALSGLYSHMDTPESKTIDNVSEEELLDDMIKSMVDSIGDPYTVYMDKREFAAFNDTTSGKYVGIGLICTAKKDINRIEVVEVREGSPAAKVGIKKGDHILKIDDEELDAYSAERATFLMKGEEGTKITMSIYREDVGIINLTMTREVIVVNTVSSAMLTDKIGYINISMFDENTADHFKEQIDLLSNKNMGGLILDLRDNGGGFLSQSIRVVSNFIRKDNLVVSVKGKSYEEKKHYSLGGNYIGLPIVILINENSASASEMLIGAMKEYKLATTVGVKSFGKGIVQNVVRYKDGTGLKVTTAKYYTPLGNNIQGTGFDPDVLVEYPEELYKETYSRDKDPQFQIALKVLAGKM